MAFTITKELAKKYNANSAEYKKQWAKDNEVRLKEKRKKYYFANKEKIKARSAQRRTEKAEEISECSRKHYIKNKESINAKNKEWRDAQPREQINAGMRKWRAENRGKVIQSGEKRALPMRECIKALSKCQQQALNQFYIASQRISKCTGIKHQVDHILPLVHGSFTGLHAPWNLQILPATVNARKGNRT